MKDRFIRFMQGRYGADQLSRVTLGIALIAIVISFFIRNPSVSSGLNLVGLIAIGITYFRMFSRNISKRYAENQKYLAKTAKIRRFFLREKNMMKQRKTHHIYSCPGCGQKIRIPRGKGKIEISCPKCSRKFVKRS